VANICSDRAGGTRSSSRVDVYYKRNGHRERADLNLKPNTPGPKERWEKFVYRERLHEHVTHP